MMKKRVFSLLLAATLLISITACSAVPAEQAFEPSSVPTNAGIIIEPITSPCAAPASDITFSVITPERTPKYVFIMIGDGMGASQRSLAESYLQCETGGRAKLIMNSLPVKGKVETRSLNADITDSAAAGTALATGYKTNNGMISVTPEGKPLLTVMEAAKETFGMSTGLVTTSRLTDATPAVFAAHSISRGDESSIAQQYLDSGVDFLAGGGAGYFLPSSYTGGNDCTGNPLVSARTDEIDLLAEFRQAGYSTFTGKRGTQQFSEYSPRTGDKVLAAFSSLNMPYELDSINSGFSTPTIAEMTDKAIECLERNEDGFVLMVEGGRIDHAGHINDAASAVFETLAFDDAVREAFDFYKDNPDETLIVVLADHETGGLSLTDSLNPASISAVKVSTAKLQSIYTGDRDAYLSYITENMGLESLTCDEEACLEAAFNAADKNQNNSEYGNYVPTAVAAAEILSGRIGASWSTHGHTGAPVPLTATGVGSQNFAGSMDNAQIGQSLFDVLGLDW